MLPFLSACIKTTIALGNTFPFKNKEKDNCEDLIIPVTFQNWNEFDEHLRGNDCQTSKKVDNYSKKAKKSGVQLRF